MAAGLGAGGGRGITEDTESGTMGKRELREEQQYQMVHLLKIVYSCHQFQLGHGRLVRRPRTMYRTMRRSVNGCSPFNLNESMGNLNMCSRFSVFQMGRHLTQQVQSSSGHQQRMKVVFDGGDHSGELPGEPSQQHLKRIRMLEEELRSVKSFMKGQAAGWKHAGQYWGQPVQREGYDGMRPMREVAMEFHRAGGLQGGDQVEQAPTPPLPPPPTQMQDKPRSGADKAGDKEEDLRSIPITLLKLLDVQAENSALRAGDWLSEIRPLIADVSQRAGQWWSRVEERALTAYQRWLAAGPLERLKVVPEKVAEESFIRLESRVVSMLLTTLPQSLKQEIISMREVTCVQIIYKVLRHYQPGGVNERASTLAALAHTKPAKNAADAVESLRPSASEKMVFEKSLLESVCQMVFLHTPSMKPKRLIMHILYIMGEGCTTKNRKNLSSFTNFLFAHSAPAQALYN